MRTRSRLALDGLFELLAGALAPARCAACDEPVRSGVVFCRPCAASAVPAPAPPSGAEALDAYVYGGAIARAIVRFKYEGRPDLARPLGDLLWTAVRRHASALRGVVVVPVPLHPSRLAERGYNQAALLASHVARHLGAPSWPMALERTNDTPRQATLDRQARMTNVARALRVRSPRVERALAGRPVLLVDDVRTTGSTLSAAAAVLRAAGVPRIHTAVVARALADAQ